MVNEAIRAGLTSPRPAQARITKPRTLGPARVDLNNALSLAGELEDGILARRISEDR